MDIQLDSFILFWGGSTPEPSIYPVVSRRGTRCGLSLTSIHRLTPSLTYPQDPGASVLPVTLSHHDGWMDTLCRASSRKKTGGRNRETCLSLFFIPSCQTDLYILFCATKFLSAVPLVTQPQPQPPLPARRDDSTGLSLLFSLFANQKKRRSLVSRTVYGKKSNTTCCGLVSTTDIKVAQHFATQNITHIPCVNNEQGKKRGESFRPIV